MYRANIFRQLASSNNNDREVNDYYATHPKAVEELLKVERFTPTVYEPCCGEGHISKVLENNGYQVINSDLIDRGYGKVQNFFDMTTTNGCDIITNPPYKQSLNFVKHAIDIIDTDNKVAMLLKIQFLEGQERRIFFNDTPPRNGLCVFKKDNLCKRWRL